MSGLLERIQAAETCAVVGCDRHRGTDSLFCGDHLTDMWRNRLERQPDGTFIAPRRWPAKDMTGQPA